MIRHLITLAMATAALVAMAQDTSVLSLSLSEVITRARKSSVDAEVALNQLKSAYWGYRSYRAELLPEVTFTGSLPSYRKQYSSYMESDGSYSFVPNNYLQLNGEISVSQNIWLTGGRSRSTPRSTFTVSLAKARTTASCRFLWLSRCRNRSSVSTP